MAHITTVRLPVPRRVHTTDFWNGLAVSGRSRQWGIPSYSDRLATTICVTGGNRVEVLLRQ